MDEGSRPIYLDAQATTPMDPRVLDAMLPFMTGLYGNPHSRTHAYGWETEKAVEQAREHIANLIGADAKDWNATEWMKFLNDIDNKTDAAKLEELDRAYGLAKTGNNEVAFRFYRASVHAGYRAVRPNLEAFLLRMPQRGKHRRGPRPRTPGS